MEKQINGKVFIKKKYCVEIFVRQARCGLVMGIRFSTKKRKETGCGICKRKENNMRDDEGT